MDTGMARGALAGKGIQQAKEGNTLGPITMTLFYATDFADRLARTPPTLAVLLYQGKLRWEPGAEGASEESDSFTVRNLRFCLAQRFVYATVYRRCDLPSAAAR